MMSDGLLTIIYFILVISAAVEPSLLNLKLITPNDVMQLKVIRQIGTQQAVPVPGFTPLRLEDNKLFFQKSADATVQILPTPPENFSKLIANSISPNTQSLVAILADQTVEGQNHVVVWDIDVNSPTVSFTALVGKADTIAWRPDSHLVAINSTVYDAATGDIVFQHVSRLQSGVSTIDWCNGQTETRESNPFISWSPDSTRYAAIAYYVCASSIAGYGIFDAETGALLFELENSTVDTNWTRLIWNQDGAEVTDGVSVWSAKTGSKG